MKSIPSPFPPRTLSLYSSYSVYWTWKEDGGDWTGPAVLGISSDGLCWRFRSGTHPGEPLPYRTSTRKAPRFSPCLFILDMKKRAGIEGIRVSPHTLRHTFARTYLAHGGDLGKLSRLMGHSKVSTTEEYLKDFSSRDARVDQSEFSPAAGLKGKKSRRGFQKTQRPDLDSL
jgi:hypothetical protein